MSPSKVPSSVLAALGLVGVVTQEGCFGPCLDIAFDSATPDDSGSGDSGDDSDTDDSDTDDSDTGPCLEAPAEMREDPAVPLPVTGEVRKVRSDLLDRGVLPADVAGVLANRKATD